MPNRDADHALIIACEYPPFPGGTGTYAANMVEQLRAHGVHTVAFVPDYPGSDLQDSADTIRILGHHQIGLFASFKIANAIRKAPANAIILAADIRSVLLVAVAARLTGRKYRSMVHGSEAIKFEKASPLKRIVGWSYKKSEMISCNSQATLDTFCRSFGPVSNTKINYLGVDAQWYNPPIGAFDDQKLAALAGQAQVIISVGRVEDRKGQLETIEILRIARERYGLSRFTYIVAGRAENDDYVRQVRRAAEQSSISLYMPGRVSEEDIKRLYERAVCHLLCAQPKSNKIEGFGLVLLEAGAQRCPSVVTRVGGIPEVVGDGNPLLFAHDDVQGMAFAIARLASDRSYRKSCGDAALQRAKRFDWLACAQGTFPELYIPDLGDR